MKGKVIIWVTVVLVCFIVFPTRAQLSNDIVRSRNIYMNMQYAGNVGLVSIGAGTDLWRQKLYLGLIYGYLSEKIHDAEVHTLAIKAHYRFVAGNLLKEKFRYNLYAGLGINLGFTDNTYVGYPDYYPDGYYYTNAIHFAPYVGGKIFWSKRETTLKKIGVYCELGTIDKYIADVITSNQVSFFDIWNLGVGISYVFDSKVNPKKKGKASALNSEGIK